MYMCRKSQIEGVAKPGVSGQEDPPERHCPPPQCAPAHGHQRGTCLALACCGAAAEVTADIVPDALADGLGREAVVRVTVR
jgi:hypothetical protein